MNFPDWVQVKKNYTMTKATVSGSADDRRPDFFRKYTNLRSRATVSLFHKFDVTG